MTQLPVRQVMRRPILVRRDWLVVSVITVVMVAIWVSVTVYTVLFQKNVSDPLRRRLQQFTPDVDEGVFGELSTLRSIDPDAPIEGQRVMLRLDQERQDREATPSGAASEVSP